MIDLQYFDYPSIHLVIKPKFLKRSLALSRSQMIRYGFKYCLCSVLRFVCSFKYTIVRLHLCPPFRSRQKRS